MTINNIALVRATDIIPFDGMMHPISETQYLKKDFYSVFASEMKRLLEKEKIIPPVDFSKFSDEYISERNKMINKIVTDYIPYTSDYNSMILFSLNGLVPNDAEAGFGNNTFSNKNCVVIEGLTEQIENIVSLVPTDTAIKGSITLSPSAIVMIKEEIYNNLTPEEKNMLEKQNFTLKTFSGPLKEEVYKTLKETNRYIPEELSLSRPDNGYKDSPTKDQTINTINQIAKERNIAQTLHYNVLMHQTDDLDKLDSVKDEVSNFQIVEEHYQNGFYTYLFNYIKDESLEYRLMHYKNSPEYIEELMNHIKKIGIDNYKNIVISYNQKLEQLQKTKQLFTPEEIVTMKKEQTKAK